MLKRTIVISKCVKEEVFQIITFIEDHYQAPITAKRFFAELQLYLLSIANHADIYPLNPYIQLQRYGSSQMRKTVFRDKWVILFDIDRRFVYINKIVHTSMIKG